jgi:CheY-like chemotaxis protein
MLSLLARAQRIPYPQIKSDNVNKNVLLVDDEYITNVVHKSMLERNTKLGYIESVVNGRQAIDFLERSVSENKPLPDYIFLDINMPIMNGFQFLEELQHHFAIDRNRLKIIMLSSSIDPGDRQKAERLGADGFLSKPLEAPDIEKIFPKSRPE